MNIKKYALILLAVPAMAGAQSSSLSFSIGDTQYNLLETSVRQLPNKTVVSLWDVTAPGASWRWSAQVTGCHTIFGTITMTGTTYDWSAEGNRAYDLMAASACLANNRK